MSQDLCGMVLVDKGLELSSHDVVRAARKGLGLRRVGHGGTLDPLATGLLPVFAGRATRLVQYMHLWPKTYVGTIVLGVESASGDAELAPAREPRAPTPPRKALDNALTQLTGTYHQQPPAYSAKKIGGVAAHKLARRGLTPTLLPQEITVHRLRVVSTQQSGVLAFAARVSSGTYLRSLARDLGRLLGTGAFLGSLRRTGIGPARARGGLCISTEDRRDAEAWRGALVGLESIPLPLPTVLLSVDQGDRFCSGNAIEIAEIAQGGRFRVTDESGSKVLGIGEFVEPTRLEPRVVFADPPPRSTSIALPGGA